MRLNNSINLIRTLFAVATIIVLSGCGGGKSSGQGVINAEDYRLVWSDEFNGNTLDTNNWTPEIGYGSGGWGNNESQLYTSSEDNVKVENGNLVITARCPSGVCGIRDGSITSARIITKNKFEFKYGKVNARIKVPAGKSTWPAFWMLGANFPDIGWPASGEIDIMEVSQVISTLNNAIFAVHFCDDNRTDCSADPVSGLNSIVELKDLNEPLSDDFHEFELEWSKNVIIGRVDGVRHFIASIDPDSMSEFLEAFFLILNVAVDGKLGQAPDAIKTIPQEMLVDWVRVYQGIDGYEAPYVNPSSFDSGLLTNGDFEVGTQVWIGNAANVTNELLGVDGSRANDANIARVGKPWDVNLSQILEITQGKTYNLSFWAKSDRFRTILTGIGLNGPTLYTNDSKSVNLTTDWKKFDLEFSSESFGDANSRVFFDMGAEIGQVIIDEVSLVEVE